MKRLLTAGLLVCACGGVMANAQSRWIINDRGMDAMWTIDDANGNGTPDGPAITRITDDVDPAVVGVDPGTFAGVVAVSVGLVVSAGVDEQPAMARAAAPTSATLEITLVFIFMRPKPPCFGAGNNADVGVIPGTSRQAGCIRILTLTSTPVARGER